MSACPSSDALARFANGDVEPAAGIEAHLDTCSQCRAWLDAFFQQALPGPTPDGMSGDVPRHLIESALDATRAPAPETPEQLPRRLGDYDLLEVIGRGGMGVVYRSYDRNLRREVAIKVLAPSLLANPEAAERFQREARAAAALQHENVLPVHAFGGLDDGGDMPYLAMPLVRGESLETRLARSGRLSVTETVDLARQIAAGLAAAHEAGIVHRDIKPANVLVEKDGKALIADFGLARMGDDASLTLPDARAGTPHFMAPEQANGGSIGPATDLFCLGALLYRMLAGRLPFAGDSTSGVLHSLATTTPPPIRKTHPEVPAWLSHLIEALLEKSPRDRPASARRVGEMLATESAPGHPSRRQRRFRRRLLASAVLLLAGGLFVASERTGRSAIVNATLSKLTGRPFSIRGTWGAYQAFDTAWNMAEDGQSIDVRLRGDYVARAPDSGTKAVILRGFGSGRLLETQGRTLIHGRGDSRIENLTIVRTASNNAAPQPLVMHEGGTLTLDQCRIAFEKAAAIEQLARREALLRLDDSRLIARNSTLSSASTYLIHLTGGRPVELSFEHCGLRGFTLLVLDGGTDQVSLQMQRSTLSALGCFISPRGRPFPDITVAGSRNLLRCGTLVWKSDGRPTVLAKIDWNMNDSVLGEFRSLFGRDETLRQSLPDSDSVAKQLAARWPDAAATLRLTDDLGMPRQQNLPPGPGEFTPSEEWMEYGYGD